MIGLFNGNNPTVVTPTPDVTIVGSFAVELDGTGQSVNQAIDSLSLQDDDLIVIFAGNDHSTNHTFQVRGGAANRNMTEIYEGHEAFVNVNISSAAALSDDQDVFESTTATATAAVVVVLRGASTTISASDYGTAFAWNIPNPPSISVTEGDLVIAVGFIEDTSSEMSVPSGYTLLKRAEASEGVLGDEDVSVCAAYKYITATGAENPSPMSALGGFGSLGVTWRVAAA